jgi:hypothetical protein
MFTVHLVCDCGCGVTFPIVDTIKGPEIQAKENAASPFAIEDLPEVFTHITDWVRRGGLIKTINVNKVC